MASKNSTAHTTLCHKANIVVTPGVNLDYTLLTELEDFFFFFGEGGQGSELRNCNLFRDYWNLIKSVFSIFPFSYWWSLAYPLFWFFSINPRLQCHLGAYQIVSSYILHPFIHYLFSIYLLYTCHIPDLCQIWDISREVK